MPRSKYQKKGDKMWRVQMTFKNKEEVVPGHDVTYVYAKTTKEAEANVRRVHGDDFGGLKEVACRIVS